MKDNFKISIIMPIYNSEKSLNKTIKSIINQTIGFENLELILIDDKSTDNTKKIIEKYAETYDNIIPVYLTENSGKPGYVRNIGIDMATSDYLMFMDSDDEYKNDMCEMLYNTIITEKCDLVGCNYIKVDNLTKTYSNIEGKNEKIYIYPEEFIYYKSLVAWNKIFKKSIIINNNIRFITDKIGEDIIFCMDYIFNSNFIVHLNDYYGYIYYNVGESFSSENIKWVLNVIDHNYDILNRYNKYLKNMDVDKFFQPNIKYLIYCSISLEENDWKSMYKIVNEIYKLEKTVGYTGSCEKELFYKTISHFIIKNHLKIATSIIYIINKIRNNTFILKLYRRLILKRK